MADLNFITHEYLKIVDIISQYDDRSMIIKGWSITVGMALIGYAFANKKRSILILCIVSAICFIIVDAKFKEYQVCYYHRMSQIESCLKDGFNLQKADCVSPAINRSWDDSKKWYGIFPIFYEKPGVLLPHFIIIVLAAIIYRKSE